MKFIQKPCKATIAGVVMSLSLLEALPVDAVTLNFEWTGNAGYSARGSFSYDETQGYTIIDNSNIQSIAVSFFDPSKKLLNSFAPVTNGSIVYDFLDFNYDTATKSLFGYFDVGQDNGQSTDYYLLGNIDFGLSLRNPMQGTIDESNGLINFTSTTPIPEPLTTGGILLTGSIAWLVKRRQVTVQKAKT